MKLGNSICFSFLLFFFGKGWSFKFPAMIHELSRHSSRATTILKRYDTIDTTTNPTTFISSSQIHPLTPLLDTVKSFNFTRLIQHEILFSLQNFSETISEKKIKPLIEQIKATNLTVHLQPKKIQSNLQTFFEFHWWKPEQWDIPNKLTLARTIAIPLFITTFVLKRRATTLLIYILSCITDFLDGYLARKWKITSELGAFLDPVADKLMVTSALVLLTVNYPTLFFILPVSLIIGRELAISGLREWMSGKGLRQTVQVSYLGKVKTAMQMIATSLLLLVFPGTSTDIDLCLLWNLPKPTVFVVGLMTLYIATIATVLSGVDYFASAWNTFFPDSSSNAPNTRPFFG